MHETWKKLCIFLLIQTCTGGQCKQARDFAGDGPGFDRS